MKSITKLIIFIIFTFLTINNIYANHFYSFDNNDNNISKIEKESYNRLLTELNNKYNINLDVILLGKDSKSCYKQENYIKCIVDNYGITGNYLWVINKGIKEETGNGDVNSYMNSNVQNTRSIFNEQDLKRIQDKELSYLVNDKFNKAIHNFIIDIKNDIENKCSKYKDLGKKYNVSIADCNVNTLAEKKKILDEKENIEKEKIKNENLAKTKNLMQIILELFIGGGIFALLYGRIKTFIKNKVSLHKTKKLYKDIEDYSKYLIINEDLLEDDLSTLLDLIKSLLRNTEILLTNEIIEEKDIKDLQDKFFKIKEKEEIFRKTKYRIKNIDDIKSSINDINI